MSYILDALRKSEQQRLAGGVPGLNSGQSAPLEPAAPGRNWLALAAILLAINAGAVGWWLATRPGPAPGQATTPESAKTVATTQKAALPPVAPVPSTPIPTPAAAPVPTPPPAAAPAATPTTPQATDRPRPDAPPAVHASRPEAHVATPGTPRDADPPVSKRAAQTAPPTTNSTPPSDPDAIPAAPPRSGVIAYADLPPAVKKALPPLQISGYADGDGEPMLVVDDRLVHEGDEIGSGVRVLKISPDGAVFGFRNYRFRR